MDRQFEDPDLSDVWPTSSFSLSKLQLPRGKQVSLREISAKAHSILHRYRSADHNSLANALMEEMKCGKENKNVKRRTYDALNVMVAAGAIKKHGQFLRVLNQNFSHLNEKRVRLKELANLLLAYKHLSNRNSRGKFQNTFDIKNIVCLRIQGPVRFKLTNNLLGCNLIVKANLPIKALKTEEILKSIKFPNINNVIPAEVYNLIKLNN